MTPQEAVDILISDGLLVSVSSSAPKLRQLITECVTKAEADETRRCANEIRNAWRYRNISALDCEELADKLLRTGGLEVEE